MLQESSSEMVEILVYGTHYRQLFLLLISWHSSILICAMRFTKLVFVFQKFESLLTCAFLLTRSFSRITLSRPSLTSRLKIANRSYYHSAPIWSTSRCSSRYSFFYIKLACLWSFNLSFFKKLITYLIRSSFPPYVFTYAISGLISTVLTKLLCFISHIFCYHSLWFRSCNFH